MTRIDLQLRRKPGIGQAGRENVAVGVDDLSQPYSLVHGSAVHEALHGSSVVYEQWQFGASAEGADVGERSLPKLIDYVTPSLPRQRCYDCTCRYHHKGTTKDSDPRL